MADLMKTINDDDSVEDFSENSDEEVEYQPKKHKTKDTGDFDSGFQFVSSTVEYNHDTWDDLRKYIKRKAKDKVTEKIQKSLESMKNQEDSNEEEEEDNKDDNFNLVTDDELSDSDMKRDALKVREKKQGKRKKNKTPDDIIDPKEGIRVEVEEDETFFEDAPPYDENSSFYQMNLSRPLMKAISSLNYAHPTPIQAATIPVALLGRDICGCAATGTGKTAAYMLPILERLLYRPKYQIAVTRVLVLVPTRELGVQVYQVTKQLAQFTNVEVGLSVGGLELKVQEGILRKSPDIVIATPGRLIDHLQNTPTFSLEDLEVLVLDEADRMLDENFAEQMEQIVKMCSRTRQTLLFSATMTEAVNDLASVCLTKPVKIFVDSNQDVAFNLRQEFVRLRKDKETDRDAILAALICRTFRDHTMVFVRTKMEAHKVLLLLGLLGVKVCELHGNLNQLQRLEALRKFKDEEADVLVATDVAARGLDIKGVKTVINYIMPPTLEHYIHRVGRTARAGKFGISVSIAAEEDRKVIKQIIKRARNPVKNRIIPPDIISKYRQKVENVQEELIKILKEEKAEKQLNCAEQELEKSKRVLHSLNKNPAEVQKKSRSWFQTPYQRQLAKQRAKEAYEQKVKTQQSKKKRKDKKKPEDGEEMRMQKRMQKVEHQQARIAKRKQRPKKINAIADNFQYNIATGPKTKKRKSAFDDPLVDVSRKSVKNARYMGGNRNKQSGSRNKKSRK